MTPKCVFILRLSIAFVFNSRANGAIRLVAHRTSIQLILKFVHYPEHHFAFPISDRQFPVFDLGFVLLDEPRSHTKIYFGAVSQYPLL